MSSVSVTIYRDLSENVPLMQLFSQIINEMSNFYNFLNSKDFEEIIIFELINLLYTKDKEKISENVTQKIVSNFSNNIFDRITFENEVKHTLIEYFDKILKLNKLNILEIVNKLHKIDIINKMCVYGIFLLIVMIILTIMSYTSELKTLNVFSHTVTLIMAFLYLFGVCYSSYLKTKIFKTIKLSENGNFIEDLKIVIFNKIKYNIVPEAIKDRIKISTESDLLRAIKFLSCTEENYKEFVYDVFICLVFIDDEIGTRIFNLLFNDISKDSEMNEIKLLCSRFNHTINSKEITKYNILNFFEFIDKIINQINKEYYFVIYFWTTKILEKFKTEIEYYSNDSIYFRQKILNVINKLLSMNTPYKGELEKIVNNLYL